MEMAGRGFPDAADVHGWAEMKVCTVCKKTKPLDNFSPSKNGPHGRHTYCKPCFSAYVAARRVADPTIEQEQYKKHRLKNIAASTLRKQLNPEAHRESSRRFREKNPEYGREWFAQNKELRRAYNRVRKKRIRQATPPWVDLKAIRQFYLDCPSGCHVDHIWPLNGKNSSGLHVLWNLQYLTIKDNLTKSNREPGSKTASRRRLTRNHAIDI